MIKIITGSVLIFVLFISSCQTATPSKKEVGVEHIDEVLSQSTEMMIHDISNPPLAMRFYAYICLAGYEVASNYDKDLPNIKNSLNDYPKTEIADVPGSDAKLSTILAMSEVASQIQPSGFIMKDWKKKFIDSCINAGWSEEIVAKSHDYAKSVASKIMGYAKNDGYRTLSKYPRYAPKKTDSTWYATPPGYLPAVEPYFSKIRPFLVDSLDLENFKIPNPIPYSNDKSSEFFLSAKAVYEAGKEANGKETAAFWDCNPFAISETGHLMVGLKKISPGAHWMGIAGIACAQSKTSFNKSLLIYSSLSVNMMDGFWLCWKEKYRTDRIRPETAIRQLIDPSWKPFLQTPPFPEYPSGHSVVSSTAATVLSHFFGKTYQYKDTVERRYGITDRSFNSFEEAAAEAGLSRFHGGIHFKDAIENGQILGTKMGTYGIKKLKL